MTITASHRLRMSELKAEGKTLPEIAAAIGCSIHTVYMQVSGKSWRDYRKAKRHCLYQKRYKARLKKARKSGKGTK